MKRLNILDLQRKINERKNRSTACFERILEICHKKILFHCDRKNMRFFYEVPEYMFGYPLFNVNDAIRYVVNALSNNGFLAVYYFPKFIYISWDMDEIDEHKKQTFSKEKPVPKLDIKHKPSGKLTLDID